MLLISKTSASLDQHEGNFGKVKLLVELKICEIQSNIEGLLLDAFHHLNCKIQRIFNFTVELMPSVSENGSREILMMADILMGKLLLKVGSMKLDASSQERLMEMQEESKIAEETET